VGGSRYWGIVVVGAALVGGTGCFAPPPEAVARLEEVKRQSADLDVAADTLEERFLGNQAKVQLWQELQRRHKNVSQIAIANHQSHLDEMMKLYAAQQEKARRNHNNRVASASGTFAARGVPPPKRPALNAR